MENNRRGEIPAFAPRDGINRNDGERLNMIRNRRKSTRKAQAWQQFMVHGEDVVAEARKDSGLWIFKGGMILLLLILSIRLFELQVVQGNYHLKRSEENRLVTRRLAASRGVIRDRNGEVLTRNIPTYKRLEEGTTIFQGKFEPISREEALDMRTADEWVFFDISREYLYGRVMAPVVGYISEVGQEELDDFSTAYVAGDLVGKAGVEKTMETFLRGTPGYEYVEITSMGETVRTTSTTNPIVGSDVVLSIDLGLQNALYQALEGYLGAGVAVNPQNGEILALVSRPTYNPNDIVASLEEEDKPFFNRAIGGGYPPGSIYKIVSLTAGLEEGAIEAHEQIEDTGEIKVNGFRFGNWLYDRTGGTDGMVDAVKAIQRSNDIYFYRLGEMVGVDALAQWSEYFGLGSETGVDLPGEYGGIVPNPIWKERTTGDRWYLGNTYHMAIGQGDLQVTPLQMALATSVMANGGRLCAPKLILDDDSVQCKELGISQETIDVVMEGMKAVCDEGGTASRWQRFSKDVACKTGTAQYGGAGSDKTHAWFSVIAPAENPEIVLIILLEGGGGGSEHASPVAMEVLEEWYGDSLELKAQN